MAIELIRKLRTASSNISAAEAKRLLADTRELYQSLPPEKRSETIEQVLAFLDTSKPSPATLHNRLDHLVPLLIRLDKSDLIPQLEQASPTMFAQLPGTGASLPLYKTLRTLWKFLAPEKPIPEVLNFYGKNYITAKYLLSQNVYSRLLRHFQVQASDEDQIIWFYLATSLRLRTVELKNLSLNDVWLVRNLLIAFVLGKGKKRRQVSAHVPIWMGEHIQDFITSRSRGGEEVPLKPLFNPKNVTERKMRTLLDKASIPISLHDLRRYQANLDRANGEPLLEGIGKLGHSTSQTIMTSYVTVLPLLQAECINAAYKKDWAANFSSGLSANSVARSMGMSREAVRQYKIQMAARNKRLSLEESTALVACRIRSAISAQQGFQ